MSSSTTTVRAPPPALTVLTVPPEGDAEMRDAASAGSGSAEPSPKSRNALGLTLPGSGSGSLFAHSIDAMLGGTTRSGCSPPRRIIHEADEQQNNQQKNSNNNMLKTPPLICEQGPSAPASPTSPSPASRCAKRPCPLSVDALQRLNLLSPNYIPPPPALGMEPSATHNKLAPTGTCPVSPGYPTSDLGSSPRSSISASHYSALGIGAANWTAFRDAYAAAARQAAGAPSGNSSGTNTGGGFLTPHQLLSPAPFSPFSDYGVADLHSHATSTSVTPYSSRSPNLSPSPIRRGGSGCAGNLHFSFDQIRSRSSLSNPAGTSTGGVAGCNSNLQPITQSLDLQARERSRSEGEALAAGARKPQGGEREEEEDERMDTGSPLQSLQAARSHQQLHAGQKRRLLHKSRRAPEEEEASGEQRSKAPATMASTASTSASRQPTIEEPPPSPTLAELFQPGDLDKERKRQVEEWIRQQTAALEAFRHSLIPAQQEANLLQVPQIVPQNSPQLEQLWSPASASGAASPVPPGAQSPAGGGPIRPATLWRRSRSESDVSAATAAAAASAAGATATSSGGEQPQQSQSRRASQQHARHGAVPQLMIPLNEATHVCEHCGQGFSMHDRLAKHIASRHRDRSASMNDENSRVHKCTLCPKSFGRSDMLTRHMRLHTGLRPYVCHLCGQVFSRSDHLSTHQRTHTGEKPYRCPQCNYSASRRDMITRHMRTHLLPDGTPAPFAEIQIPPINELTLNPNPAPPAAPPPSASGSGGHTPQPPQGSTPRVQSPEPRREDAATEEAAVTEAEEEEQRRRQWAAAAQLLSAATAAGGGAQQPQQEQAPPAHPVPQALPTGTGPCLEGLLNSSQQMMLSTLQAQLPAHLRRSSPNMLLGGDCPHPSAFRPPQHALPAAPAPFADHLHHALSALSSVQQLLQQQQQQQQPVVGPNARLSLPGDAATALPFLFRQNSFGGLGFADQQQHNQQQR